MVRHLWWRRGIVGRYELHQRLGRFAAGSGILSGVFALVFGTFTLGELWLRTYPDPPEVVAERRLVDLPAGTPDGRASR